MFSILLTPAAFPPIAGGAFLAGAAVAAALHRLAARRAGAGARDAALAAELRDQKALLRGVIDASPHATFWKDVDGRYLGCNGVFPAYVGERDEAGVVGKTDLDFGMNPADADHYRACDRRVMESGEPIIDLEEQIDLRGDRRDLFTSKIPLRDARGAVCGVVGVFADVTDRKRTERDLKASMMQLADSHDELQKLGLVAKATRHSVIIADARGRVEWVNDAFTALTGYALEEVFGEKPGEVLQGPDTCPETKLRIGAALRRGEPVCEEIVNYCKGGTGYPIRLEIEPVRAPSDDGSAGEIVNFVAIQVDLREQKAQEAALRDAKDAAEAANRTKSAFLANMSHEIRTPLNGILGFADVLRSGDAGPAESAEYLDTIRTSGDHLLGLINDILDLSKVEAGKMEFEPVRCDPHAVIAAVLSSLRVKAVEKGLTLECRWAGDAPETIVTDPGRLRQLLTNLVGNAIKFTETGSVRLMATLEEDDATGGPRFVVEVHDTGEGVPADKLEAIFAPFAQADASVTRRHGGTGLGLAIGRKVAEGLGGTLTATSRVGWGSVFRLSVHPGNLRGVARRPAVSGDAVNGFAPLPPVNGPPAAGPAAGDPGAVRGDARVLLVEDGEVNRRLIGVVLKRAGLTPTEAVDGRAGADAAQAAAAAGEPFDLILMDMQMPVLDGYAAAAELRAAGLRTAAGDPTPVIALTAHAMDGDRDRCLAAGCTDYLSKPVRPADLLAKLAALLPADAGAAGAGEVDEEPAGDGAVVCDLPPGDEDLRGIAREFAAGLPGRVDQFRAALAAGDRAELERAAHQLKGAGETLGFAPLTAPAAALEAAAADPAAEDAALEELLGDLAALTDRVRVGEAAAA